MTGTLRPSLSPSDLVAAAAAAINLFLIYSSFVSRHEYIATAGAAAYSSKYFLLLLLQLLLLWLFLLYLLHKAVGGISWNDIKIHRRKNLVIRNWNCVIRP